MLDKNGMLVHIGNIVNVFLYFKGTILDIDVDNKGEKIVNIEWVNNNGYHFGSFYSEEIGFSA